MLTAIPLLRRRTGTWFELRWVDMLEHADLIFTLTAGLTVALLLGFITHRLHLSPIVGYLLAGIITGPFTPGYVAHLGIAQQFAEIGVVLLMFGVGLHFHPRELFAVRAVAIPGALAQIAVSAAVGVGITHMVGYSFTSGLVFGLATSVASTVVVLRMLSDVDALHTPAGRVTVGWLIVEDIFTVLLLVVLPSLSHSPEQAGLGATVASALMSIAKILALIVLIWVAGKRAVPGILHYVAKTRSRELFTLTILVIALGIAVGSAALFGASMALGAFLAGIVVGQSEFSSRAGSEALPMRDAFAVLFFVSVGMLFDPAVLRENLPLSVLAVLAVVLVKPLTAFVLVMLLGRPVRTATTVAIALGQIGEFSFILSNVAEQMALFPRPLTQALVLASLVSVALNPLLFRALPALERWLLSRWHLRGIPESSLESLASDTYRAIVVGHGPVGSSVARLLQENQVEPVIIELNHQTVNALLKQGVRAIYGDASQSSILEAAGVRTASSLIFAASDSSCEAVIRAAKEMNPQINIVARSTYLRDVTVAKSAGADFVVAAEAEVALAMVEHLMTQLGATSEQLDRARGRVRADFATRAST